jgi:hypothetical protein
VSYVSVLFFGSVDLAPLVGGVVACADSTDEGKEVTGLPHDYGCRFLSAGTTSNWWVRRA